MEPAPAAAPPEVTESKARPYELRIFLPFTQSNLAATSEVLKRAAALIGKTEVTENPRNDKYFIASESLGIKLAERGEESIVAEVKSLVEVCHNTGAQRWEKRVEQQMVGIEQMESVVLRKERMKLKLKKYKGVKQIELTHVQCLPQSELQLPEDHVRWVTLCIEGKRTEAIRSFGEKIGHIQVNQRLRALDEQIQQECTRLDSQAEMSTVAVGVEGRNREVLLRDIIGRLKERVGAFEAEQLACLAQQGERLERLVSEQGATLSESVSVGIAALKEQQDSLLPMCKEIVAERMARVQSEGVQLKNNLNAALGKMKHSHTTEMKKITDMQARHATELDRLKAQFQANQ